MLAGALCAGAPGMLAAQGGEDAAAPAQPPHHRDLRAGRGRVILAVGAGVAVVFIVLAATGFFTNGRRPKQHDTDANPSS